MAKDHTAYYAALAADEAFQKELVRVYGPSKASDARYRERFTDPELIKAYEAKRAADDAQYREWLKERGLEDANL